MSYYTVRRGDCLSSIAKAFGFADYQTIYQHPENAEFRQKRPNPNIIYPADVLYIPDLRIKQVPAGTDQRHTFIKKRPRVLLRLCLKDDVEQPYTNTLYHLRVDSEHWDDSTDAAGIAEREIQADATEGEITIFPGGGGTLEEGYTFTLQFGDLDPVNETSGVDARLVNLGYGPPDSDGTLSPDERRAALSAFQDKFGLEVTGEASDETKDKLREVHDGE